MKTINPTNAEASCCLVYLSVFHVDTKNSKVNTKITHRIARLLELVFPAHESVFWRCEYIICSVKGLKFDSHVVSSVQSVTFLRRVTMMQHYSPPHKRTYTQHFTINKLDVKMFD